MIESSLWNSLIIDNLIFLYRNLYHIKSKTNPVLDDIFYQTCRDAIFQRYRCYIHISWGLLALVFLSAELLVVEMVELRLFASHIASYTDPSSNAPLLACNLDILLDLHTVCCILYTAFTWSEKGKRVQKVLNKIEYKPCVT